MNNSTDSFPNLIIDVDSQREAKRKYFGGLE